MERMRGMRAMLLVGLTTLGIGALDARPAMRAPVTRPAADPLAPTGRWSGNARGSAAVPPMGWSSWNAFAMDIDEVKILGTAQALVDTGLVKLGYRYVNIDDGWWLKRRLRDGRLMIRTNLFPGADPGGGGDSSFRPLTDRLHAMGLKAGLYTDIGRNSCGQSYAPKQTNSPEGTVAEREIGLGDHVEQDARLFFGEWRFDYLKVDGCGIDDQSEIGRRTRGGDFPPRTPLVYRTAVSRSDIAAVRARYQRMADAIAAVRPDDDYVYSVCLWGAANVRAWGKDVGNVSRTSDDIRPAWGRMLHTFDSVVRRPLYAHPGAWNDPDMLFIGHGDFDAEHLVEARSHFTMWAMVNAPLLIGYDLRHAPRALLDIWGNADLVRANQDPGGHQAVLAYDSQDAQILVKTLGASDHKIVALVNRTATPIEMTLLAAHLKFAGDAPIVLRDLWSKRQLAPFTGERAFTVQPHETLVFEASGRRALGEAYYLSELPGRINVAVDGVVFPEADPTIYRMASPWDGTRESSRPVYAGWGGAGADESPYQTRLAIVGQGYASGIGILANSRMEVRNDARFGRFTTTVGIDDSTRNTGASAIFEIYGDGHLLARSRALRFGSAPVPLTAQVRGVQIIELVVRQAAGRASPVSGVWADAILS